jgi:CheY-like chemotaxis protein
MSQTLVLSAGSDHVVLATRELILRSAGHIVVSAASIKEAVQQFRDGDFDLIILCHTLPQKDCQRLICFIRASGSRIPIASVSGGLGEYDAFADTVLEMEPTAFLAGIQDLLIGHAPTQSTRVPVPRNNGEVSSSKEAPRSGTGLERHERGTQNRFGTLSFLERERERVHSQ